MSGPTIIATVAAVLAAGCAEGDTEDSPIGGNVTWPVGPSLRYGPDAQLEPIATEVGIVVVEARTEDGHAVREIELASDPDTSCTCSGSHPKNPACSGPVCAACRAEGSSEGVCCDACVDGLPR